MTHDKTNQSNDRVHFSVTKRALFGAACALMGGMVFAAGTSFATLDNDPGTSDVLGSKLIVPYDGFLMLDSQAVDGAVKIKFDLYDVASGGSSVWTETQIVTAYQGRFSVGLGTSTDITNSILDAEQVYLAMTIIEVDANGNDVATIELGGRQAIEAAPYAAWAANSADMKVSGALTVAGTATLDGFVQANAGATILGSDNDGSTSALTVGRTDGIGGSMLIDNNEIDSTNGALHLNRNSELGVEAYGGLLALGADNDGTDAALRVGRLDGAGGYIMLDDDEIDASAGILSISNNTGAGARISGDLEQDGTLKFGYDTWDNSDTGDGGATIVNDNSGHDALMIVGNNLRGDRRIEMYNDVYVQDELEVVGDLTVTGDITNFTTTEYKDRTSGTNETLTPTASSICFLTRVKVDKHNEASDSGDCYVYQAGNGNWIFGVSANGAQPECSAACLSW